ncbi:hypothetical protein ACFQH6_19085 [Halobacteriaceae archaeon GCM10025711]
MATEQSTETDTGRRRQTDRFRVFVQTLFTDKLAIVGVAGLSVVVASALLAPVISPYDPLAVNLQVMLEGPSLAHPSEPTATGATS